MNNRIMLLNSDARRIPLAGESVQCIVTSPPYYGLRDYGSGDRQIGLEDSLQAYVDNLVQVFAECWRVLKPDGIAWLNLGDSYNGSGGSGGDYSPGGLKEGQPKYPGRKEIGFKPKDLMLVPHRTAIALQEWGWWVRMDNVWYKRNPMPESVTDRPTKAHEYIFLLSKSQRYYYDADAVAEKSSESGKTISLGDKSFSRRQASGNSVNPSGNALKDTYTVKKSRNKRSVWDITTKGYPGAHYAVFPPELPEICIKSGSRAGDIILDPFAGSGTTLMVANQLGRKSIGLDISFQYLSENAKERTGMKAMEEWENGKDGTTKIDDLPMFKI